MVKLVRMNTPSETWRQANRDAATIIGGHTAVAKLLGYEGESARQKVFPWTSGKRMFPPEHCPLIEQAAKTVTRRELRPDDWQRIWPEMARQRAKKAIDTVSTAEA